jgi:uncharacterized protein (TIGR03437 family)
VPLAPVSIATIYGTGLASASTGAGGTSVVVRDQTGAEADASLLYVSSGQINFVLPGGAAVGNAVLKVMRDSQLAGAAQIVLASVAPGLFAANGQATGPAAAMVVYVATDGSQTVAPAYACRAAGDCSTAPISLQPGTVRTYLMLFGTGIRGVSSQSGVRVTIGGVDVPVLSAGAQMQNDGLDQVNVELPGSLRGRGDVDVALAVDGKPANVVTIRVL